MRVFDYFTSIALLAVLALWLAPETTPSCTACGTNIHSVSDIAGSGKKEDDEEQDDTESWIVDCGEGNHEEETEGDEISGLACDKQGDSEEPWIAHCGGCEDEDGHGEDDEEVTLVDCGEGDHEDGQEDREVFLV